MELLVVHPHFQIQIQSLCVVLVAVVVGRIPRHRIIKPVAPVALSLPVRDLQVVLVERAEGVRLVKEEVVVPVL
jgi:hypothetical protein